MKWETGGHPGQKEISRKGDEKRQIKGRMMCPALPPAPGAEQGQRPRLAVPLPSGSNGLMVWLPMGTSHSWTALLQRHRWFLSFLFTGCIERISKTRNFAIIDQKCSFNFIFFSIWCTKNSLRVNTQVAFRDFCLWFPLIWDHPATCPHSAFIHPYKAKRNVVFCLKKYLSKWVE